MWFRILLLPYILVFFYQVSWLYDWMLCLVMEKCLLRHLLHTELNLLGCRFLTIDTHSLCSIVLWSYQNDSWFLGRIKVASRVVVLVMECSWESMGHVVEVCKSIIRLICWFTLNSSFMWPSSLLSYTLQVINSSAQIWITIVDLCLLIVDVVALCKELLILLN